MNDCSAQQDDWNEELEIARMATDYDCTSPVLPPLLENQKKPRLNKADSHDVNQPCLLRIKGNVCDQHTDN